LPECVGHLAQLRELHLRNNRLTGLPDAIGGLRELRQIDLRGNPLTSIPECLTQLEKLDKIDLRWVTTLEEPLWMESLRVRGCLIYW
ncbi:MAG: leucine-rich repeat domain-containing protein, partial [Acidobacteriaceae bacterium]